MSWKLQSKFKAQVPEEALHLDDRISQEHIPSFFRFDIISLPVFPLTWTVFVSLSFLSPSLPFLQVVSLLSINFSFSHHYFSPPPTLPLWAIGSALSYDSDSFPRWMIGCLVTPSRGSSSRYVYDTPVPLVCLLLNEMHDFFLLASGVIMRRGRRNSCVNDLKFKVWVWYRRIYFRNSFISILLHPSLSYWISRVAW